MRNRLVAAFVGLTLAVIALYGVPRAIWLSDAVRSESRSSVGRTADYVRATVEAVLSDGEPVTDEVLGRVLDEGERAEYVSAAGRVQVFPPTGVADPDDPSATRALVGGGSVTVTLDAAVVDAQVRDAVTPLLLIGIALVPVAALAGLVWARRLSRPFAELAAAAERMGTGRLEIELPHYRIPEAEAIARSLASSAAQLDAMIRREREVAVHASHQLRTPITALRLTLEDLALWPETTPEVADELNRIIVEVDRFSEAVTALLEDSRQGRMQGAEELDLSEVVQDAVVRWTPVVEAVGLRMVAAPLPAVPARLSRVAVTQVVDLVLQHACEVAADTISVRLADRGSHVALDVAFAPRRQELRGAPAEVARMEATDVAASLGGRLSVEDDPERCSLVLMLPAADAGRTLGDKAG
jgi:signal transduction histidine kinase